MNLFRRVPESSEYPKTDAGSGSFDQYSYGLVPKNRRVTMRLAGSDQFQDEIARLRDTGVSEFAAFFAKRTAEEERTDAPLPARFFTDSRMSGVVGYVPRGLEPIVFQALSRLEMDGRSTRIPAEIDSTRHGLRVVLLMGTTR